MILRVVVFVALLLGSASAQTLLPFVSGSASGGGGGNTPTLVQHIASSANPVGLGISGDNFVFKLPNAIQSGNCLILGIAYPNGATASVSDSLSNSWSSAVTGANSGGYNAQIFLAPVTTAGVDTLTISFGASQIPFEYTISEFANTNCVANGTTSATNVAGASLASGSFTPGNNNANGGNLIWNYYALSGSASGNPSSWVPGGSFSLLDGDIAWTSNQGFPHASQFFVQTTSAAINPGITATGDSSHYNAVAVALKAANSGSVGTGLRIVRAIHFTLNTGLPAKLQYAATGNIRFFITNNPANLTNASAASDSDSGSWTKVNLVNDQPQIWYSASRSPSANETVTFTTSGTATGTWTFYDIAGATSTSADSTAGLSSTNVSSTTSLSSAPNITPTNAGICIAGMGLGQGPGLSVTAPSGAIWDFVNYTGQTDLDLMDNADAAAHVFNSTTAAQSWSWTFTSQGSNTAFAEAACFH